MFGTAMTASMDGMDVHFVTVEADVRNGLPGFQMVGDLSAGVREAAERVRAAIQNSGYPLRPMKILVNLSPADLRKRGPGFDLPVAAAVMAALGLVKQKELEGTLLIGELSLNGEVKKTAGVLPVVMEARKKGYRRCVVPMANRREAEAISGITIWGADTLREAMDLLNGLRKPGTGGTRAKDTGARTESSAPDVAAVFAPCASADVCPDCGEGEDYADVCGQELAKRAIEIAVAGAHNLLMIGPPGAGKSMLAERIPTILPELSEEEVLEISRIYSICGLLDETRPLIRKRPFRMVHHSVTRAALIGGGHYPKPGEISLASGGVLFLDEFAEMDRRVVESLRQPMEERTVRIARTEGNYRFPADFQLFAAMNPCPCGNYPDLQRCRCTRTQIDRYLSRISRPLLERIDICIEVPDVPYPEVAGKKEGRSSAEMKEGILRARAAQKARYRDEPQLKNSLLTAKQIQHYCALGEEERAFMGQIYEKLHLSARTYHNVLKVARTIADLEESDRIRPEHLAEASGYRMADLRGGIAWK